MEPFRQTPIGKHIQGLREARKRLLQRSRELNKPPRKGPPAWTGAELKRAIALHADGVSWEGIAEEIGKGRSSTAVKLKVKTELKQKKGR